MALKLFFLLPFVALSGCKEFYDEEFLEEQNNNNTQNQNVTYTTTLTSTDAGLSSLTGTGQVDVQDDEVKVDLDLKEIPQNIVQVHYVYSTGACSSFTNSVPAELGSTRSLTISEELSSTALNFDVSSGAGDGNLEGKSLLVRGFSNLQNGGATVINIACGELVINDSPAETGGSDTTSSPDETPPDDGIEVPPNP